MKTTNRTIFYKILKKIFNYNHFAIQEHKFNLKDSLNNKGINVVDLEKEYLVEFSLQKFYLRKNSSDVEVFKQIFFHEEYRPLVDIIKSNNINVTTLVDAGSNIGLTTIYLKKFFPELNCISIEPDLENHKSLTRNISLSKLSNVSIINSALWYNNEKLSLDTSFRDGRDWSFAFNNNAKGPRLTSTITISEILSLYKFTIIDILKIDIEGAERFIFDEKLNNLTFLKNIKIIAIEIHDEFDVRESIYKTLRSYNFTLFNHGELTIGVNPTI